MMEFDVRDKVIDGRVVQISTKPNGDPVVTLGDGTNYYIVGCRKTPNDVDEAEKSRGNQPPAQGCLIRSEAKYHHPNGGWVSVGAMCFEVSVTPARASQILDRFDVGFTHGVKVTFSGSVEMVAGRKKKCVEISEEIFIPSDDYARLIEELFPMVDSSSPESEDEVSDSQVERTDGETSSTNTGEPESEEDDAPTSSSHESRVERFRKKFGKKRR